MLRGSDRWPDLDHRPDGDAGGDSDPVTGVEGGHPDHCCASRSRDSSATSSSRAASAPSPSAVSRTSSPHLAPRAITPRMLRASTGSSPDLLIWTGSPVAVAAWTNSAAGRACRPTDEAMVTVRCDMTLLVVGGGRIEYDGACLGGLP